MPAPSRAALLALVAAPLALLALPAAAVEKTEVLATYADIAKAGYEDSLATAKRLQAAVEALTAEASPQALAAAKAAWLQARVPYQQTEAFRFGNPVVDDWEGRVNAWPLDEGLIDYVEDGGATDENPYAGVNVIASESFELGGRTVDASTITPELLSQTLHEADGIEANVATGYHAIEFLLWGQDMNGTDHGAGARPWTDYATGEHCTGGNCDRRAQYLAAAAELLVSDLEEIVGAWGADGAAREALMADPDAGVGAILTGMGSLSYGELAGERMKLGLMLHDPEEEHDCFSDNTHRSHYNDALGIRNVYLGEYKRTDGSVVKGASLSAFVSGKDSSADTELRAALDATMNKMTSLSDTAEKGERYDQMLAEGNTRGNEIVQAAVDALTVQTRSIERVVAALGLSALEFEGSDSLDNPGAVFQ